MFDTKCQNYTHHCLPYSPDFIFKLDDREFDRFLCSHTFPEFFGFIVDRIRALEIRTKTLREAGCFSLDWRCVGGSFFTFSCAFLPDRLLSFRSCIHPLLRAARQLNLHLRSCSIFVMSGFHRVCSRNQFRETLSYISRIFPRFRFSFLTTVGPTKVKLRVGDCDFNCENKSVAQECTQAPQKPRQLKSSATNKHCRTQKTRIYFRSIFSECAC